ncbi:MAG: hypothetical protein AB1523_11905 [Bacillota bacterium]
MERKSQLHSEKPKVVSLIQFKWRRTGQLLRRKLGDFADQPFFAQEASRARQIYVRSIDPSLVNEYDEFVTERFFEWFIFDYQLSTGRTLLELFLESPDLSAEEKELLREWAKARLTLYEVLEVFPGKGVVLQDLLGRNNVMVHDTSIAQEINPGMILLMRVLKVGDRYEFSTSGLSLPAFCKDVLLARIDEYLKTFCRRRRLSLREGKDLFLKENACLLNAWVIELGIGSLFPRLVNEHKEDVQQITREIVSAFLDEYHKEFPERSPSASNNYPWPSPECAQVADRVAEDLTGRGYNRRQIDAAMRLWSDYCLLAHPSFRKAAVWVASVVYTMARLELDKKVNQHVLAEKYGVSASTISANFRTLCRTLELVAFDRRYSTRRPILSGLYENYPLLARILKDLKL